MQIKIDQIAYHTLQHNIRLNLHINSNYLKQIKFSVYYNNLRQQLGLGYLESVLHDETTYLACIKF